MSEPFSGYEGEGAGLPPACASVRDDLTELALGSLTGRARVAALAHLEECARCTAEVEELSAAADLLLHLAPVAEPPVGFEARVFERLGLLQPAGKAWPWKLPKRAVATAAAVVVLAAFGLGALIGHGTRQRGYTKSPIELASLVSAGKAVGQVYVYAGNPTWLFMVINNSDWQGTLRCEVMEEDRGLIVLGRFWLSEGRGAWADSVYEPAGRLVQARVIDSAGKVLAVADLDAS